jgi:hypothetical protein
MEDHFPVKAADIRVGDRVIIVLKKENHLDRGYVRFVGELAGMEGTFYGIELDEAKGIHDGKGYFTTQHNHGTFVKLNHLRRMVAEDFNVAAYNTQLKKEQAAKVQDRGAAREGGAAAANAPGHDAHPEEHKEEPKAVSPEKPAETPKPSEPPKPVEVAKPAETSKPAETPKTEPAKPPSPKDHVEERKPTPRDSPKHAEPAKEQPKAPVIQPKPTEPAKPAETAKPATQPAPTQASGLSKQAEAEYIDLLAKKDKEMTSLKSRIRSLEEQLLLEKEKSSKPSETEKLEKEFEAMENRFSNMSIMYESLKSELENTKYKLDEANIRIQELELDKEEMMLQAELATEDNSQLSESDINELKKNYGFIKMAFSKLEERSAADNHKNEQRIQELENKLKNSDGLNSDQVKKIIKEKEQMIKDLKQRLEESSDANNYINTLTEQYINAKNSIAILEDNLKETKNTIKLNEEIIEEYEEMNGLLSSENENAVNEITTLKETMKVLEDGKKQDEAVIAKYREKIKLIQGEIDIIKSQSSESKEQDKIHKIDQLIKNYTICLQEKRAVVKKLIVSEFKDIKDARQNLKWNIIMKSIPNRFIHELEYPCIDKYLTLIEISKKIDLIIGQMKSNYLQNPLVIEDNLEIISHISNSVSTLLNSKRIVEYILDYGYSLEKLDDLKNLTRSPMFNVLVSYEVLLDRLITEIREDNFNSKFSLKLLEENNTKLLELVNEITKNLRDVKMKESIDIRYYAKLIELQYLVMCDYADHSKTISEQAKTNITKLANIANNVQVEQSWIRQYEDILKKKPHVLGGNEQEDASKTGASTKAGTPAEPSTPTQSAAGEDERIFFIEKVKPCWDSIAHVLPTVLSGQDAAAQIAIAEDSVSKYILTNAKKPKSRDEDEEYPFHLFSEMGPWMDSVNFVKRKLEKFDELQKESADKSTKIEEANKKLAEADLKADNYNKVKTTLENRIKDLEFKNQNIPLIESEKVRAVEQTKILNADIERLKKENSILEERLRLGGSISSLPSVISTSSTAAPSERKSILGLNMSNMGNTGPRGAMLKHRASAANVLSAPQPDTIPTKSILSYERIIENLHSQLVEKDEDNIFDNSRMMKEMPFFYKLYSTEKKKGVYGSTLESEGKRALGKLNLIAQQLKNKVVAKKVVDITQCTEKDPLRRLQELSQKVNQTDLEIEEEKERAVSILEEFQNRWVGTYANNPHQPHVYSKLLTDNSRALGNERVIGHVRIENLAEDKLKQAEDLASRVLVKKSEVVFKKAFKL